LLLDLTYFAGSTTMKTGGSYERDLLNDLTEKLETSEAALEKAYKRWEYLSSLITS